MAAIPLSSALGSPVSAALLGLDGALGFRGWQWLFIVEALPSILLAVVTFFYLTDRPADAGWLDEQSRRWLMRRLALGDTRREHVSPASAIASLTDIRVLALSLVYFGNVACLYGVSFWLPRDHRHQEPLRHEGEEVLCVGDRPSTERIGALAEIVEEKRRIDDDEPREPDRPRAEMADIGVHRFTTGDHQHQGAEDEQRLEEMRAGEKAKAIERIEGRENLRLRRDRGRTQNGDRRKPEGR